MRIVLIFAFLITANNIFSQTVVTVKVEKPVLEDTAINLFRADFTGMVATYGFRSTGDITMKDLYHDGLVILSQGVVYDSATILGFQMSIRRTNRIDMVSIAVKGSKLSDRMKALLKTVKPGNYLYFDIIKVRLPDGVVRRFEGIALRVIASHPVRKEGMKIERKK